VSHQPFICLSLPRSRSHWLARFLSYRDVACGHEEARHIRGVDDVRSLLSLPYAGSCETAAAPFWRLIVQMRPDIRIVTVRRPVSEVVRSLIRLNIPFDEAKLTKNITALDRKLDQIEARVPGVLSVNYTDLSGEEGCRRVWEHCLPYAWDQHRWFLMSGQNMQIDMHALMRYRIAFGDQMSRAAALCAREIRSTILRNRQPRELDGITFQEETFDQWWEGGQKLFAEHCLDVGETHDAYLRKNVPLMKRLAELGAVQFMTARCNGRMFGYLVTVIGPSLEDENLNIGTQTTFYGSRDVPGLGLRLQRASLDALKRRGGTWDIIPRAGVRGSGQRMEALYRRLGAEDNGRLFRIRLEEAA